MYYYVLIGGGTRPYAGYTHTHARTQTLAHTHTHTHTHAHTHTRDSDTVGVVIHAPESHKGKPQKGDQVLTKGRPSVGWLGKPELCG